MYTYYYNNDYYNKLSSNKIFIKSALKKNLQSALQNNRHLGINNNRPGTCNIPE